MVWPRRAWWRSRFFTVRWKCVVCGWGRGERERGSGIVLVGSFVCWSCCIITFTISCKVNCLIWPRSLLSEWVSEWVKDRLFLSRHQYFVSCHDILGKQLLLLSFGSSIVDSLGGSEWVSEWVRWSFHPVHHAFCASFFFFFFSSFSFFSPPPPTYLLFPRVHFCSYFVLFFQAPSTGSSFYRFLLT